MTDLDCSPSHAAVDLLHDQSTTTKPAAHVIDDDWAILDSTAGSLSAAGFHVWTYASARDFLEIIGPDTSGCIVTDVNMPGITGIELVSTLRERGLNLPIIIVTAYVDTVLGSKAMKQGAVGLLEKPFKNVELTKAIRQALANQKQQGQPNPADEIARARISSLTDQEKDVLARLLKGTPNRPIADELGLSIRALELRRATVMSKLKTASINELVKTFSEL